MVTMVADGVEYLTTWWRIFASIPATIDQSEEEVSLILTDFVSKSGLDNRIPRGKTVFFSICTVTNHYKQPTGQVGLFIALVNRSYSIHDTEMFIGQSG